MYAYLLDTTLGIGDPQLEAGIISLKKVKAGFLKLSVPDGNDDPDASIDRQSLKKFEEILFRMIQEIFDPGVPFDQTTDPDICRNCPYINLCGR